LQELHLWDVLTVPGDALALTALTGLTCLTLRHIHMQDGVDTAAVCALAGSLKQLRCLELSICGFDFSSELLSALRQLMQLTELRLSSNSTLTQQALMQLTGLTKLKKLCVEGCQGVTGEVVCAFWAAMRQQQQRA
jgi:hypothetical protein